MIYIASPYSHDDKDMEQYRYERVKEFAAELMRDNHVIYSPIVHGHDIASSHDLPTNWEYWKRHCLGILRKADSMIVYCIPGWRESKGVAEEIAFCQICAIPIEYRYLDEVA